MFNEEIDAVEIINKLYLGNTGQYKIYLVRWLASCNVVLQLMSFPCTFCSYLVCVFCLLLPSSVGAGALGAQMMKGEGRRCRGGVDLA